MPKPPWPRIATISYLPTSAPAGSPPNGSSPSCPVDAAGATGRSSPNACSPLVGCMVAHLAYRRKIISVFSADASPRGGAVTRRGEPSRRPWRSTTERTGTTEEESSRESNGYRAARFGAPLYLPSRCLAASVTPLLLCVLCDLCGYVFATRRY